jgi:uncharacterized protein (DUF1800 family)
MSKPLDQLDPQQAWAPYEPSPARPWTRGLAAHLFRRAGFGATAAELDQSVKDGPAACLDRLCNPPAPGGEFESTSSMLSERTVANGDATRLAAWWLYRMLNTPDPLLEKLILFWHGHFAASAAKVEKPRLMLDQNQILRQNARGKFEQAVRAISRDPAMLIYLDSATNRRIHPNENFARELMELFTLGVGNYSEKDIKEVARAFTGYEVLGETFHFDAGQHDSGVKSFLGRSGNFDGDQALQIVLEQPSASRFIARKLIRFFVFDEPAAPDALVEPIARELREKGFQVGDAVRRILASNLFFSEHAIGRKIRSPVELCLGLLRSLGGTTNLVRLAQGTADLGQALFQPPNVKGWDGGRAWINSSTVLGRVNLVGQILSASETQFGAAGEDLKWVAASAGAATPRRLVDFLLELLVAVPIPSSDQDSLTELAGDAARDRNVVIRDVIRAMAALPEFQLA